MKRSRLSKGSGRKRERMRKLSYEERKAKLKPIEWITGNKMKFNSGFKTFDRQTKVISTGNVIADTQLSFFIRPYTETVNPVGEKVEKGHLQEYDLGMFRDMPFSVRRNIRDLSMDNEVIVYEFRHYSGENKIVDGYVVTDSDYKLIAKFYLGDANSRKAVDEASKYVSWV